MIFIQTVRMDWWTDLPKTGSHQSGESSLLDSKRSSESKFAQFKNRVTNKDVDLSESLWSIIIIIYCNLQKSVTFGNDDVCELLTI